MFSVPRAAGREPDAPRSSRSTSADRLLRAGRRLGTPPRAAEVSTTSRRGDRSAGSRWAIPVHREHQTSNASCTASATGIHSRQWSRQARQSRGIAKKAGPGNEPAADVGGSKPAFVGALHLASQDISRTEAQRVLRLDFRCGRQGRALQKESSNGDSSHESASPAPRTVL